MPANRPFFERYPWLAPLLILSATLLAYWSAYQAGFIWDDDDYVTQNPVLRSWGGLWQLWTDPRSLPQYYPLVHSTFWIEFQLWELDPVGYHAVNVILHALSACLVYRILRILEIPGALFAALLFAVHPVHVESVAWVTERKNVLSGLFYLLSLRAYLHWRPLDDTEDGRQRLGVLAFVFFLCALLSKTVTCSLPAAILLITYWKRGSLRAVDWKRMAPYFAVGLAFALYTASLERDHVRAVGSEFDFSVADRLLIAGRSSWFYLGKLLAPYPLSFNYTRWELDPSSAFQWAFPIAIALTLLTLFVLRRRIGRGPLVAALFFGGSLVPALGFFNTYPMRYSFVADHFQYLASLGPLVLLAAVTTRWIGARLPEAWRYGVASVVVIALSVLTFQQGKIYEGHEALWRDTLAKNEASWISMNNLAKVLLDRGDNDEAIELLERSLEVRESFESHLNLGALMYGKGEEDAALVHFERSIELKPDQAPPRNNKAIVLMDRNDLEGALAMVDSALERAPDFPDALGTKGQILVGLGRQKDALPFLSEAIKLNPNLTNLLTPAAGAALAAGDTDQALNFSANAVAREPGRATAVNHLVEALQRKLGELTPQQAAAFCRQVLPQLGTGGNRAAQTLVLRLDSAGQGTKAAAIRQALGLR